MELTMEEQRQFDYRTLRPQIYELPSFEVEKQAFDAMHLVEATNGVGKVENCELVLNLPGPIYVFSVNIQKFHGGTDSQFVIAGCLTYFRIDNPKESDLPTDARNRLLLYFGYLLLYCLSKPKYKPPFLLRKGLDRSRYLDSIETKSYFYDSIKVALGSLGYSSVAEFMPITTGLEVKQKGMTSLDGRHYQRVVENPIDIDYFLKIGSESASNIEPRFYSLKGDKSLK
jgi:hypothetical protein